MDSEEKAILREYEEETGNKYGLICLNCFVELCTVEELQKFAQTQNVSSPVESSSKLDYLSQFARDFKEKYDAEKRLRKEFETQTEFLGDSIVKDEVLKPHLIDFDFYAKQDLIEIFADYCADLGISVYNPPEEDEYNLDLYLTRKTPLLRTEAVFVRTGAEMNEKNYKDLFYLITEASKISSWTVMVTTPYGIEIIGLDKIIKDMEKLRVWLYVVNPVNKKIYGITKGKTSKDQDSDLRDNYIKKLPREPIRAPSQVVDISKYEFNESESYKSKNFVRFEISAEHDVAIIRDRETQEKKYVKNFRTLMIIHKETGIPIFSYSSEQSNLDDVLVSGFLTAMDNFVSEIGGTDSLNEINYKGFYVQAGYGENVKMAAFSLQPSDFAFKQRLEYLINEFEIEYDSQIQEFARTGNVAIFNTEAITKQVRKILDL